MIIGAGVIDHLREKRKGAGVYLLFFALLLVAAICFPFKPGLADPPPSPRHASHSVQGVPLGEAAVQQRAQVFLKQWLEPSAPQGKMIACSSTLHGDFSHEACGEFCKPSKATNHCKYCKCRTCSYCAGSTGNASRAPMRSPPIGSIAAATVPSSAAFAVGVTSVFLPHLLERQAAGYALTLFSRPRRIAYGPTFQALPLRAYYDGPGALPTDLEAVEWLRLGDLQPWAEVFIRENSVAYSAVQRAYGVQKRFSCVAPSPRFDLCNDIYTAYKLAAIYDTVSRAVARYVIWCDLDTIFQVPLDERFWAFSTRFDAVTIGSKEPHNPETGILVLDSSRTQELVWLAKEAYRNEVLRTHAGGVNDIQIFGFLFAAGSWSVGWFAVGCRDKHRCSAPGSQCSWMRDSLPYKARSYQFCPSDAATLSNVSPFNVLEFITHLKNHSGPINHAATTGTGRVIIDFCRHAGRNGSEYGCNQQRLPSPTNLKTHHNKSSARRRRRK